MSVCLHRYIQGAPLTGNTIATTDDILAVDTPSDIAEAVMVSTNDKSTQSGPTLRARFIGQGYKQVLPTLTNCETFLLPLLSECEHENNTQILNQVCGRADVWGDGVVPEVSAHLEGALNISFDGVYHSPVGSDDEQRPWYGAPAILKQWVHHLLSWTVDGFDAEKLTIWKFVDRNVLHAARWGLGQGKTTHFSVN